MPATLPKRKQRAAPLKTSDYGGAAALARVLQSG